jgi:serine/threonine protein kinase/Tfp pilus assembly protein PilF
MIGKTISHYKILEKLGEGGMGVVYKAQDLKLDRLVALKFLPPHLLSSEEEKSRFVHEAKASAALSHNNICTVHEIDEHAGQTFIVMEYIEGQSLKDKITERPLKLEEALDIAIQVATGLQKAHEKQIIHRDVKPANILLSDDGVAKIVDFGLAKLSGQTKLTKDGSTLGTVAYMSPEQTRGEEVDSRTDIWSLGVVLFEMLTGKLPFKGDYEQAVLYSIMNEHPEPITGLRTGIPMELERIVNKALKKNPAERYQRLDEMLVDLKSVTEESMAGQESSLQKKPRKLPLTIGLFVLIALVVGSGLFFWWQASSDKPGAAPDSIQRLAVLPFTNIREDPQTDFLGYALADQIIGELTYLKSISVRPSSSVRKYENEKIDPITAGNDLQVSYILTGNYLKEADDVRLNIELVNVQANEIVWREPIKVRYENAFTLQDLVSEKVIRGLKIQFSPNERLRMQTDMPQNPLAYEYYLRGVAQPSTIEGNYLAIELFEKSIQLDSTYAPAFNELGFRIHKLAAYTLTDVEKLPQAEQAYLRALSLNGELFSALGNLAILYTETGRLRKASELSKQMSEISPNNALAHFALGYVYRYAGLMQEAKKEMKLAIALDPQDKRFRSLGITYCYLEEYDKAFKAFEIDKGSVYALTFQGWTLLRQGQLDLAVNCFRRAVALDPEAILAQHSASLKAFIEGNKEKGLSILWRFERKNPPDADSWYFISATYALFGDKAGCLRTMRRAVESGFYNYPLLLKDSFFDLVRQTPEYQQALALAKAKHLEFKEMLRSEKL